ncbi:MAG: FAD-binding protein [Bacteroidota bacterium]|nr:FAD-binding protein [Bacteroidota bacterium]MDE2956502.1 FAD-binding protein [Bacteroidota bacterium]
MANALPDFIQALGRECQGEVRDDPYSRVLYSTDASIYQVMPYGVFFPASRDDVHAAVSLAAAYGIKLVPRGGGSSLAGQAIGEAMIMDFSRHLNRIIEVNRAQKWARVEPGLVLDRLNLDLASLQLQFGPDPASSDRAVMGGIVSNNSTGSHSIVYGMTADHVLGMNAVLSDGTQVTLGPVDMEAVPQKAAQRGLEGAIYAGIHRITTDPEHRETILESTPRHWRRCGGYNLDRFVGTGPAFRVPQDTRFNLAKLVSGAEGSLAVIQDVTVNLVDVPLSRGLAMVQFDGLNEALSAVPTVLETDPSAVELLDNLGITLCRDVPQYARLLGTFLDGEPDCVLITEYCADTAAEVGGRIDRLQAVLRTRHASATVVPVMEPDRQRNVWTVRKAGLGLLMSLKGNYKPIPFIEDAAVPPEHLADYVAQIDQFCRNLGSRVAYYGHASAGCVHIRPLINTKAAEEIAKIPSIMDFAVTLLHGYGGALSSEHGDGRVRSWMNERFFGPKLYRLYQQVKRLWDPNNLLNPGVVVDAPKVECDLRYGSDYQVVPLNLNLDFSNEQGFDQAVEMCNGAGICRKETTGVMCPSFMATREEEHSTRGRANALRAALSGRIPADELTSRRMYEVMDLCIECKACKSECPSSVDMAKIKFEFLAQYRRRHGTSLRTRLFGNIATLSRMGSGSWAPALNGLMLSRPARWALEHGLGITRRRPMPAFAGRSFIRWFKRRPAPAGDRPKVVLFNDTFNTYNDPHIAVAAVEVLEAAGFEVVLPGIRCCGRPMISKGLVRQARAAARDTVARLTPFAQANLPIVGLEPSCLLSLKDEYLYLLPDSESARLVAGQAMLFEEFIAGLATEDRLPMEFEKVPREVILHGHCHQRALTGTAATHQVLALASGRKVREVDSSCCGMAGAFGYEKEHYDISCRMAERRLLPAVRSASDDALIVAPGTSCRHQITHGTGRPVLHPAEVLRNALTGGAL